MQKTPELARRHHVRFSCSLSCLVCAHNRGCRVQSALESPFLLPATRCHHTSTMSVLSRLSREIVENCAHGCNCVRINWPEILQLCPKSLLLVVALLPRKVTQVCRHFCRHAPLTLTRCFRFKCAAPSSRCPHAGLVRCDGSYSWRF